MALARAADKLRLVKMRRYGYEVYMLWDKVQKVEMGTYGGDYRPLKELIDALAQLSGIEVDDQTDI